MKLSTIKRAVAGLSLAAAVVGGLTFTGASRADASGDAVQCSVKPTACQLTAGTGSGSPFQGIIVPTRVTTMAPERDPYVDLAITLIGWNADGSPTVQISNLGTENAGQFLVLQLSAPGARWTSIPGLAAGQSLTYHDPAFPADGGAQVEIVVNAQHSVPDSNPANDTLIFTAHH
jgi:type 1 fimbria pilin